ncbi:hypothetical protein AB3X52_05405 [Nocardioides sp. DS6]|uniref:Uncharacterized protein n=1 Tax=Nocardioides eburneus TaxID=3231482 RepID=A0ABV3SWZ8_9ACTN
MTEEIGRLAATIGVPETRLAQLTACDGEELRRLDELIDGALRAEDEAFDAGLEAALRFVPRLVRGPAKALLFPGGARG